MRSKIDYYAVITNVETGEGEYPKITNCEKQIFEIFLLISSLFLLLLSLKFSRLFLLSSFFIIELIIPFQKSIEFNQGFFLIKSNK